MSGRTVYPLTWLRGLAAIAVVTFHAYQHNRSGPDAAWPWTGVAHRLMGGTDLFVDMFFVLSGLVLWLPVVRAALDGDTSRRGRVLLYRRLARLLPLYLLIVLVVWALTNPRFPGHWGDLLTHLTFTHVYSDEYVFWTDGPAWSLAVEMHFYLAMALAVPLVHAGVRRTTRRSARLVVVGVLPTLCLVGGLAYLTWATTTHQDPENWSVWFSPLSRAADFGVGMVLALLTAAGVRAGAGVRGAAALAGTAGLAALVLARPSSEGAGAWWHPAYAVVIAVGLSSIVLHDGPWPRPLEWRPVVWLGSLGYGIYLVHEPVMRVLDGWGLLPAARPGPAFLGTAALVLVPTVALAWVSSRTVERAGLRLLAALDRDGRPRDYYAHLDPDDRAVPRVAAH